MYILGLSCFYHDAAACLIKDGVMVAAAEEERFSRVKHDWRFPRHAIEYCLQRAGIGVHDVALVCFYEKPFLKFERLLETFLASAPRGLKAFVDTVPSWLREKLRLPRVIGEELGYRGTVLFAEHHLAHAASAFFLSPFPEAAVLTVDGVGEWATASYGTAAGGRIELSHEMRFPHSLGLLYSAFTAYLGFEVNDAEYKVMGAAPYGAPRYRDLILRELMELHDDGSIRLNLEYFSFQYGRGMYSRRLPELFGVPPRAPESALSPEHLDLAASLQKVTEEVVLAMARHLYRETRLENLAMAGGVALNSVANGRLLREGPFRRIFIQPAAGDAGGAVGAAYLAWHHHLGRTERHRLKTVYLGPSFDDCAIEGCLRGLGLRWRRLEEGALLQETARLLHQGQVVGWFQGGMEFGPRGLGNRSILADPSDASMKDLVNAKIKFREGFRPFAPAAPAEEAARYFEIREESPYMLMTVPAKGGGLPAVTHVDGSARLQTVAREDNPLFHALLLEFGRAHGVPVLLNTSLNLRGEPIACSPEDACGTFLKSGMDALVLGAYLVEKKEQEARPGTGAA